MSKPSKVIINRLPTGVPGLDEILGGGIPEFSFNIIGGAPGCGKTTIAHQFVFANAAAERPAVYFTILGEPAIKMLRYQQQYDFFDPAFLGSAIRFVNLGDILLEQGLSGVLAEIVKQVEEINPGIVVVDSFRTVARRPAEGVGDIELQAFVQRLALHLTSWQTTSFLVGEYTDFELRENPVFTVADGLIWLTQVAERNAVTRKLQVVKLRGQGPVPGLHTFRITSAGVQAFPRTLGLSRSKRRKPDLARMAFGIPELDAMLEGGIPAGDSVLVAGPSGAGKSVLATQFIAEGIRLGEPGIVAVFEERPDYYLNRAGAFGMELEEARQNRKLEVLYLRPLDLSIEEAMQEILEAVNRTSAKRLVIDSLSGFEMALAPGYRIDFRESLYRMIAALTGVGITVLSTVEIEESFTSLPFSTYAISFLTDDLIRLRYVEIEGELRRIIMVVKMRGCSHSKAIKEYEITANGMTIVDETVKGYRGLISGIPERVAKPEDDEDKK
jgi:circadian clock protein KaiC